MKTSITQMISMKKLAFLSLLMVAFCAFTMQAQNRADLLTENFDGTSMPAGWTTAGSGTSNWSISATANAGGSANEVLLYWSPQFNGTSRLATPAIDLTGIESVVFSFKHALNNYSGGHTLGIATSTDGTNWHSGWSQTYSSDGVWTVNQVISTEDMGSENVRFCIYYTGNSYNFDNWYFDEVNIFTQEELDISLDKLLIDDFVAAGTLPVSFKVTNKGLNAITSLQVNYQFEGHSVVTQNFSNLNLTTFASSTLTFEEETLLTPGDYNLTVWISQVNGVANEGDELEKLVSVATASVQRQVMIEHFTSSTCGPCVTPNAQMLTLTNNNPGKYCYIKYQMNWPNNGDPYYTAEGGVRRTYYGVSAVPHIVTEGGKNIGVLTQALLNQYYAVPAYVDIRGSFSVSGNTINIKADVFPNINANGVKLFVVVNEKLTTGNVSTNGEREFRHVMMKMLPNAQGTAIDLVSGELQSFEFLHDMSSTHVEEMSDLEVAIFVQNLGSGYVHNSRFAYENTELHPYPVENLQVVKSETDLNVSWNPQAMTSPDGYKIKINGEVVEENYSGTSYTMSGATEDFYAVQIEAIYGDMTSVAVTGILQNEEECLPVTELNGEVAEHNVVLTWVENDNAGTSGYKIFRNEELLGQTSANTITDEDVAEGTYDYSVVAVCINGMESDAAHTEVVVDYSAVNEFDHQILIFPNPAKDFVKIEGENIEIINVYNTLGQLVKTVTVNDNSINVSVNDLQHGIYIFDVKTAESVIRSRVVISR